MDEHIFEVGKATEMDLGLGIAPSRYRPQLAAREPQLATPDMELLALGRGPVMDHCQRPPGLRRQLDTSKNHRFDARAARGEIMAALAA